MAGGWHALSEGSEPIPGYRLVEYLGGGSLGEVWRASGPGGTQVALKFVNLRRRGTLHEFRALEQVKNIRDPHLVPVVAYWLLDESGQVIADPATALLAPGGGAGVTTALPGAKPRAVTLIMAMGLGSKSLFQRLEECLGEGHHGIPWKELLDYMEDAARGIDFLNQPSQQHESIIHGDIKPHNILIVGNAAQVCDFGLARAVDSIRATNMPLGTVAYAAPELLQSRPLHRNTDQYCLAVSYIELRTGKLPFDAETVVGICERHVKGELDLSALKPCERTVIARAVALDPDQRWPSCREMVRALRRACEADESAGRLGPERLGGEIVPGCWLQEQLGQGSLGKCWKARLQDGSWLALKVLELDPAAAVAQVHALRAVRATRHERLLPILRLWIATEEGFVYEDRAEAPAELAFLEPYASGAARPVKVVVGWELGTRNLRTAFQRPGEPPAALAAWRDLLHWLDDVAEGLDFLHSPAAGPAGARRGLAVLAGGAEGSVVHGRLRPENVILVGHAAKIGDFGVHRALGRPVIAPSEATAPWIAPEARVGKTTAASDQFALAVCYVEIRTGQPPQPAAEKRDTLSALPAVPLDLSGLPGDEERAVVARALAPRVEDRWPSCEAFVHHLRTACEADERRLQRPRRGAEAPGSEILPGYRLVEKLGQGQIGRVWKAVGRGGMLRALKIVDLRGRAGLKELQALEQVKGIRSGNLISVSSYWLVDREGFLLTDMPNVAASVPAGGKGPAARETASFPAAELIIEMDLATKTLLQRLRECQRAGLPAIPVDELLRYMEQAAAGIDYLNQPEQRPDTPQIEIVHGDIKPQNIMIVGNTAAVGDFGLARIVQRLGIQQTGMGTPAYAAPELLRGLPHRASDQYCLAMTYVELRTGRLPFEEPDAMLIARRHLEGRLDLEQAGLTPAELAVIRKATAMDPRHRYVSCSEMVRALREAVEASSGRTRSTAEQDMPQDRQTASAISAPGVQAAAATLVPPDQALGEAGRGTPEGPAAIETQPAEGLALPPLAGPAELEPTIAYWPTPPRRLRGRVLIAVSIVALATLAAVFMHPEVLQRVGGRFVRDGSQPVAIGETAGTLPSSPPSVQKPDTTTPVPADEFHSPTKPELVKPAGPKPKTRLKPKPAQMPDRGAELAEQLAALLKAHEHQEAARRFAAEGKLLAPPQREALRTVWLGELFRQWNEDPEGPDLPAACSAMIACFPQEASEARVLRVRALVRQGQYGQAGRYLQEDQTDPHGAWPQEAKALRDALQHLIVALAQHDLPLEKAQEALGRLEAIDWNAVDSRWRLDAAEKARVDELRRRVVDRELADTLRRARDMLEKGRFAEARPAVLAALKALARLRNMSGQSGAGVQRQLRDASLECDLLGAVADLGDPAAQATAKTGALSTAEKLLAEHATRLTPEQLRLLVAGAGKLASSQDAALVARAIALVRSVCQRVPGRPELAAPLAGLWQARIARMITEREPTPADFQEFQKDWALWERVPEQVKAAAPTDVRLVDLWRTENLLLDGKSSEVRPSDLTGLPKELEPYGHYLAARIHAASGRVDEALQSLERLFGQGMVPPLVAKAQGGRLRGAMECLVTAVEEARRLRPGKHRFEPYGDAQEAKRHLRLLQAAQAAMASHPRSAPESKGTAAAIPPGLESRFQLALALAALGAGDRKAAAVPTEALARLPVEELGHPKTIERLLAPYAYLASHLPSEPQGPLPAPLRKPVLESATQLFGLLTQWRPDPLPRDEAAALYRTVIAPLLSSGGQEWSAGDERFLGAISEFLWTHLEDEWPVGRAKILEHLENTLSAAVSLASDTVAGADRFRYLKRRAQVRLAWQPPKLDEAIADADAAIALDGRDPEVRGVHAEAHLRKSRTQDLRKARIDDLRKAMESAEVACHALRPPAEKEPSAAPPAKPESPPLSLAAQRALPGYMLTLSMARLEYANFESDKRQQYLDEAARLARDAAGLIGEKDPRAFTTYMALGNACEDLAWAADQDPEKFYAEAIQAFKRASQVRQLPSAEVERSLGRCYYRAAVESVLDQLAGLDRSGMLHQAASHLEQVTRQLDPNDAEAWYFLGLVHWSQDPAHYPKAADCFETAKKLALAQSRPDYAYYLLQWAIFPWNDPNLRRDAQGWQALWGTVAPRLAELEKAPVPPGAAIHPQREAARQRARGQAAQENWDEAIRLCEQALQQVAEPDWAEVYLLLDLAQYRLKQAGKALQDNDAPAALKRADQALAETQKAQQAAISLVQLANCQNVLGQVYTTRWMATWDADDWNRAVAAYAEVQKLQPRRRIAQEAAGRIATLHIFRATRDQPPTYATLELLANGIRWQQSAYASLRIAVGESPEQFTALRTALKTTLQDRFIKPALEKAREVLNSETDPARRQQIEKWMAEWQQPAAQGG